MLICYAGQTARNGILLQSASTPTLQAALPAVCVNRRKWIPLVLCSVQTAIQAAAQCRGVFIRKMRSFEEFHTFASRNPAFKVGFFTCTYFLLSFRAGPWPGRYRAVSSPLRYGIFRQPQRHGPQNHTPYCLRLPHHRQWI
jgi:hypothetical protein